MSQSQSGDEPTWDDVLSAVGREFWKLAPQEFQESGHKDLVFRTTWQDLMYAVETAVDSVIGPAQP